MKNREEIILRGVAGSPGIVIGKAYLVDREGVDVVEKFHIEKQHLEAEINRFRSAVGKAKDELRKIIDDIPSEYREQASILETHVALLEDKMLYDKTIDYIGKEQINAEWALKRVVAEVKTIFHNMTDDYFRERSADIAHVSDRIMRNLVGATSVNLGKIDRRVILVAHSLSPAETSQIQLEKIKGFVTNTGSEASHTSIIARTLEIPAIVGLFEATEMIKTDDVIIVDGTTGKLIINPTEQSIQDFNEKTAGYERQKAFLNRRSHLPAESLDGVKLNVMGNIELAEEVVSTLSYGGDGVGLYRTEFQYLSRKDFPTEEELYERYKDVIEVMIPRPVIIRTLDINGDKAVAYASISDENNPALGLRAIRYCLKKPDVFKTQLRAIHRAAVHGQVSLLIPMISCVEEVVAAKRIIEEVKESLEADGLQYSKKIKFGIMMEVPSAVIMADIMAEFVDFFSIATNDLIQYSLAIDRGNREVAHLYHPMHPAILRMVRRVAEQGEKKGIGVYMCGEMAGNPLYTPVLLGLGVNRLSMNPQAIPAVKSMIRSIDISKAEGFALELLEMKTADDVLKKVQDAYGSIMSNWIYSESEES